MDWHGAVILLLCILPMAFPSLASVRRRPSRQLEEPNAGGAAPIDLNSTVNLCRIFVFLFYFAFLGAFSVQRTALSVWCKTW